MTPDEISAHLIRETLENLEAAGAIHRAPSLLDFTYRDVERLVQQGAVLSWLADQLYHRWAPWPDTRLVDVLKTQPPNRVQQFAAMLAKAGIRDLSDLLPPDSVTGIFLEPPDE